MKSSRPLLFQLFPLFLIISLFAVIALDITSTSTIRNYVRDVTTQRLLSDAKIIRQLILSRDDKSGDALSLTITQLQGQTGIRITIIDSTGKVLADTDENPDLMDNHGNRPEVLQSRSAEFGQALRFSHTVQTDMLYLAIPFYRKGSLAGYVRTSTPLDGLQNTIHSLQNRIWLNGIFIVLLAALVSFIISKRITQPLKTMMAGARRYAQGDFDKKIPTHTTREIGSLAESLNNMADQLNDRIHTILNQRNELESVLSSMIEGVVAIDRHDRIIRINKTAARLLDIPGENVENHTIHELVRHTDLLNFIDQMYASGASLETQIIVRHEKDHYLQVTGTPLLDTGHEKLGVLLVFNDVSKIHNLERVRSEFVGNVSHELKTPITSIQGFIETLKDGAIDDPSNAHKFIEIIERQSNRLNAIVDDLLELSRIEREYEESELDRQETNILAIINAVTRDQEAAASAKNITFNINCHPDLKGFLNIHLLQNAINNLVDNAIKYSDDNTVISINGFSENDAIVLQVSDQGNGIPENHLPRIFERFYRVDKARSRAIGGTGLGLAIVKHIILAHHGKIAVNSKINEGTTFTITLPPAD